MDEVALIRSVKDIIVEVPLTNLIKYFSKHSKNNRHLGVRDLLTEEFNLRRLRGKDEHISSYFQSLHIVKIFPEYSVREITERLQLYIDFPNRKEIVLRQLLMECEKKNASKLPPSNNDNLSLLNETITDADIKETYIDLANEDPIFEPSCSENYPKSVNGDCLKRKRSIETITSSSSTSPQKINFDNETNSKIPKTDLDVSYGLEVTVPMDSWSPSDSLLCELKSASEDPALPKIELFEPSTSTSSDIKQSEVNLEMPEKEKKADVTLVNRLCDMFPDAQRAYIEDLCQDRKMSDESLNEFVEIILDKNGDYPKRPPPTLDNEPDTECQLDVLKDILPDADPDYLKIICERFAGNSEGIKEFINEALSNRNYPTLKEYIRRQQISAQQIQYTENFNVENFLNLIPNPIATFLDPKRKIVLNDLDKHYALACFKNMYTELPVNRIKSVMFQYKDNLQKVNSILKTLAADKSTNLRNKRKPSKITINVTNIPLLQELAFIQHQVEIYKYIFLKKSNLAKLKLEAKNNGLLEVCNCCYDEEVMPQDILKCQKGCKFCKDCIVKSTEVKFAELKLDFPCLLNCGAEISLQTLKLALSPNLFSKIAQKKALEEVKAAGIEELEMCPFCDFATIPAEGDKLFRCLNEQCMKESCRECKEPNHIPLKCDEVEKDADVKARTFVENQMTEALLRTCYKCCLRFYKEEGCNKMTCSCGASMCYVCGEPVKDYKHFNGLGGDQYHLCPLYSDTNEINKTNVIKAAQMAKETIGIDLKIDPTVDVEKHFNKKKSQIPALPIGLLQARNQLEARINQRLEKLRRRMKNKKK